MSKEINKVDGKEISINQREKILEIKQDLPYPMTVLSISSDIDMEGV